jgi:hypothetical protein
MKPTTVAWLTCLQVTYSTTLFSRNYETPGSFLPNGSDDHKLSYIAKPVVTSHHLHINPAATQSCLNTENISTETLQGIKNLQSYTQKRKMNTTMNLTRQVGKQRMIRKESSTTKATKAQELLNGFQ